MSLNHRYLEVERYKNDDKFLVSFISVTNASIAHSERISLFLVNTDTHDIYSLNKKEVSHTRKSLK